MPLHLVIIIITQGRDCLLKGIYLSAKCRRIGLAAGRAKIAESAYELHYGPSS